MIYTIDDTFYCECENEDFIFLDKDMVECEKEDCFIVQCSCGESCYYDNIPTEENLKWYDAIDETDDYYRNNKHEI